jgi:hypothetical protein
MDKEQDKKKKSKKKRRPRPEGESIDASAPFILDHTKYDPMEEEFLQKSSVLKNAGQKLKEANKKNRFGRNEENPFKNTRDSYRQHETSRHIKKY